VSIPYGFPVSIPYCFPVSIPYCFPVFVSKTSNPTYTSLEGRGSDTFGPGRRVKRAEHGLNRVVYSARLTKLI
jgi:hypothetical protein